MCVFKINDNDEFEFEFKLDLLRDKVSLIVKFGLKKIILFKKNDNDLFFKYYADVENCESFRGFSFIYI